MAGATKLEPEPALRARPPEVVALVPPRSHHPQEPPDAGTDTATVVTTVVPTVAVRTPGVATPPSTSSHTSPSTGSSTRRLFLRAVFALGVIGGTAAALTPIFRANPRHSAASGVDAAGPPATELFDEMYGGRHIQGTDTAVRIDGRPLHMMRRADGGYVSVVNHFESFPTALATARAAVDELGATHLALAVPTRH